MYILRIFNGYGKDKFLKNNWPDGLEWVDNRKDATELTIDWIQQNLGVIMEQTGARRVEIIQVREHTSRGE